MNLQVETRQETDYAIFTLKGELDIYSAPEFYEMVDQAFEGAKKRVIIDFAGIVYLDSSGIGALIRMVQKAKERAIGFAVVHVSGSPLKVLQLTKMTEIVRILTNETEIDRFLHSYEYLTNQ